jgi:hypothetical protein
MMDFDDFGFAWSEKNPDPFGPGPLDESNSVDSLDTEALESWLDRNHGLWQLGLELARQARQYRKEYEHVPFNQRGWFSPN